MRLDKLLGARHDWQRRDSFFSFVCLKCRREVTDKELMSSPELGPFMSDCPSNPRKPEELEGRMITFG